MFHPTPPPPPPRPLPWIFIGHGFRYSPEHLGWGNSHLHPRRVRVFHRRIFEKREPFLLFCERYAWIYSPSHQLLQLRAGRRSRKIRVRLHLRETVRRTRRPAEENRYISRRALSTATAVTDLAIQFKSRLRGRINDTRERDDTKVKDI